MSALNFARRDVVHPAMPSPAAAVRRHARPRPPRRLARGFTLIEMVAAFAVLVVGLAMAMEIAAGGLRQARQAADYTEAALLAQSVLDTVGMGERLEVGELSGEWDEGFRWVLTVSPYELQEDGEIIGPLSGAPVELLELDLEVSWKRGEKEHAAHYRTLRAMLPEAR